MVESPKIRKDNDPSAAMLRQVTNFIAQLIAKTSITPNQVTILNFIIFVPLILYFFLPLFVTIRNSI